MRGSKTPFGIAKHMDRTNIGPRIQIAFLQFRSQCFGLIRPTACKSKCFSICCNMKIGIYTLAPIFADSRLVGNRLHRINIDAVRILFVRRPRQHSPRLLSRIPQKLVLFLCRVTIAHDHNDKIFLIISRLMNHMHRKCGFLRCFIFRHGRTPGLHQISIRAGDVLWDYGK